MIDYGRLDRAIAHYTNLGYTRIESPWTVTQAISNITKPLGTKDWEIAGKGKVLVASGEQSFLYLYLKGFLPNGRYQTVTPCFRDEPFDATHTKYFIKNELIVTDEVSDTNLKTVVRDAREFFENELGLHIMMKPTTLGYDLEAAGIELGSYGIRNCEYLTWIYGTGCAEPRLSMVKEILKKNGLPRKGDS